MSEYYNKYLKYKNKYIQLKNEMDGGNGKNSNNTSLDSITTAKRNYVDNIMNKYKDYPSKHADFIANKCYIGLFNCYKTWEKYIDAKNKEPGIIYKKYINFSEADYQNIQNKIIESTKLTDYYNKWNKNINNSDIINSFYDALITIDLKGEDLLSLKTTIDGLEKM